MAAITAAAIGAGAGILGDVMSQGGASATNAANMQIAQMNNEFNANQAQLNRNFQSAELADTERYDTQMSDSAMQRRVADLKAAGLNPMLAISQGGASAPMVSPPSGSVASSSGNPVMQNPNASFSQLGNQVSGAISLATQNAQIAQLKASAANQGAQAANTQLNTDQVIPAQVDQIKSQTGLNDVRATEVAKNVQMLNYMLQPYGPNGETIGQDIAQNTGAQAAIKTHMMQMDQQTQSDTMLALIKARNDENFANSIGARNISNASSGTFGKIMSYFQLAVPATNAASQAAGAVGRFLE